MWKLESAVIVLSAIFCFSQCQVPRGYVDSSSYVMSYTAQYNTSKGLNTVTLKNRIYTVIIDQNTINLRSIITGNDQPQQVLSCKLLTPDTLTYSYVFNDVVKLGNGKLVLVASENLEREEEYCFHIIIDPFDCSRQRIVKMLCQLPTSDLGVIVIPYQDSYDVITKYGLSQVNVQENQKNSILYLKNPQRFNDKGEIIELDYFIKPDSSSTVSPGLYDYSINTIKPFDASEGYYCSYQTFAKGSILQRLNSRFEIVKEISLHDRFVHVSTTQGQINYCDIAFNYNNSTIICKFLNADLEVTATSELPKLNVPSGSILIYPQVINLPNHRGFVLTFGYSSDYRLRPKMIFNSIDFYLQQVEAGGSALPYYWKIGNVSHIDFYNPYGIVDSEKDFCHVMLGHEFKDSKVDFQIRCLDFHAY